MTYVYGIEVTDETIAGVSLPDMVEGYIGTELWSGTDSSRCVDYLEHEDEGCTEECLEGTPENPALDANYDYDDFTAEAYRSMVEDCRAFLTTVQEQNIEIAPETVWGRDNSQVGHDFSLTRNGHGAGFWDRYYKGPFEALGDKLSDIARPYGQTNYFDEGTGKLETY